jgi:hypothetical protein
MSTSQPPTPPNPANPQAGPSGPATPAPLVAVTPERRKERADLLDALRTARGTDAVIAYVTSTRPNLQAQMAQDAVRVFFEHLPAQKVDQLDLLIHSDGGDGIVPWRIMTLLRERAERVNVLVPHRAFSAATQAARGADEIIMHPMGMLGPIDPTVTTPFNPVDQQTGQKLGVSVEDVAAYNALVKEDVGIQHEDELIQAFKLLAEKVHPLTLGSAKRGTAQARMLGEKLIQVRNDPPERHKMETLLEQLTTKLYYHGHPIARAEARELGLPIPEDIPTDVENAMWDVYLAYEGDLLMDVMFDPVAEVLNAGVLAQPALQGQGGFMLNWAVRPDSIGAARAIVESSGRADVFRQDLQVSIARQPTGVIIANTVALRTEWVTVT